MDSTFVSSPALSREAFEDRIALARRKSRLKELYRPSSKVLAGNDDLTIMVERFLSLVALVVRALQVAVERSEIKDQTRKLRNWREVAPIETAYVPAPAKAYVTRSGR